MGQIGLNKETFSAILGGIMPAIAWMIFWVRSEEKIDREPWSLIIIVFILGMLSVFIAVPLEHLVEPYIQNQNDLIITWAAIEEIVKFFIVYIVIKNNTNAKDPIDFAMYMIVGGLGFAGLENILFLMDPSLLSDSTARWLTGNLRYFGSTLLHSITTGIVGIGMGLAFYNKWKNSFLYILIGFIMAISLHSVFNLFIINSSSNELFKIFGLLWVITIISILLLEKLRRLKGQI